MDRKVEPLLGRLVLVQGSESSELLARCRDTLYFLGEKRLGEDKLLEPPPRAAADTQRGEAILTVIDHQVVGRVVLRYLLFAYSDRARMSS